MLLPSFTSYQLSFCILLPRASTCSYTFHPPRRTLQRVSLHVRHARFEPNHGKQIHTLWFERPHRQSRPFLSILSIHASQMQVSQTTSIVVSMIPQPTNSPRSLRSVPSYSSFDSQSTELPAYSAGSKASPEIISAPSSPASSSSSSSSSYTAFSSVSSMVVSNVTSPLGPIHHSDPAATSRTIRVICKMFPRSLLAKRLEQAEEEEGQEKTSKKKKQEKQQQQQQQRVLSEKEQLELEAERAAILEADRILGHNLKQLGL